MVAECSMADLVVVNDVFLIALCNRRNEASTAGLLAIPDEEYTAELQLQEVIMSILPLLVDSFAPAANNDVELLPTSKIEAKFYHELT
jgi:hypothetical protein